MAVTKIDLTRQASNSGNVGFNSFKLTNVLDPTTAQDAATKAYVDSVAAGIDWKGSVRAATTTAGTLASSFANTSVIDGVTLATGDRILIKDQAAGAENGLYTVNASGAPTRSTDADTSAEVTPGMAVFVEEGTTNDNQGWTLTTNAPIVLGTTALTFTQFTGLGQITVGNVIQKVGNQISVSAMATGTIIVGNAGTPTITAVSGDITVGATGITSIGANKVTLAQQAALAANSVIGNSTGSSATPTAVPMVTAPTASAVMIRDANANVKINNTISNLTTTVTANSVTVLTVASSAVQQFTGTTAQTLTLPDATTLTVGHSFTITNRSTGSVTVNSNGGAGVQSMAAGSQATITVVTVGTIPGTWDSAYSVTSAATGTVTSVSVVSANGFAGSVATATTTPAITVSTTITGVLKGNGTAVSAATVGTDYVNNASFVTRETPSGLVNGSNTTYVLGFTPTSGTECIFVNGIMQEPGAGNDYTISGATITYLTALLSGDKIRVNYMK